MKPKFFHYFEFLRNCTVKEVAEILDDPDIFDNFETIVHTIDKIRGLCGFPIFINSSYRNAEHNRKVGGVLSSQHLTASACDFTFNDFDSNLDRVLKVISEFYKSSIGQVIIYKNFVHIGLAHDNKTDITRSFRIIYKK